LKNNEQRSRQMTNYAIKEKLIRYIDAGFPIIYINTFEELKADGLIQSVVPDREILEWNSSNGLIDFKTKTRYFQEDYPLESALSLQKNDNELDGKVLVLKDIHSQLEHPRIIALIKDISMQINKGIISATIIIVSTILNIPKELEKCITVLEMDYIDTIEIKNIIKSFVEANESHINQNLMEEMSISFKGLSEFEIKDILALAFSEKGELTREGIALIFYQKQQMIKKSGVLEMIPLKESISEIGGLENLKVSLKRKAKIFKNIEKAKEFGVDIPKGLLITGLPGCGKSLSAKAAAKLFEVPLVRLDMGRLMGKYVGESESNMRKAIALAEAISPCILWVDELEKAFAGIGGNGSGAEITTRLFGNFLTWMQEKDSPTFVLATANDITKLPPELLRKGRFDEIFYVGLPNKSEREQILKIHLGKRRKADVTSIDIPKLVNETDGYSGADIEGVIRESIENVFAEDKDKLTTEAISNAIKNTSSLSVIMKDKLESMSKEYEKRKFKNASTK
jgi:SpoVK/Ycf46/Vps4 family AAA+-type ATPase